MAKAKYNAVCCKCNQPIKGWLSNGWFGPNKDRADDVSWVRNGGTGTYHERCSHITANHPDYSPRVIPKVTIPTDTADSVKENTLTSEQLEEKVHRDNAEIKFLAAIAPTKVPEPSGLAAMLAAEILPHLEGKLRANTADVADDLMSKLDAMVKDAVQNSSKIIKVENKRTGETKDVGRQHEKFPKLLTLVSGGNFVYMHGAPGSGKSTAAINTAKALSLPYGYISLSAQTAESRLLGFMNAVGVYVETEFYRCYKNGGVFCIDEMDNASANLLTALNSALENRKAAFPHEVVDMHSDFVMVATGNTVGYGANPMFPERRPMDQAFRERFVFFDWGYDELLERDIAMGINDASGRWVDWVQKVRKYAAQHFPRLAVTPRASIKGAGLLVDFSPSEVADMVIFKGFDKDSKDRIVTAIPYPKV